MKKLREMRKVCIVRERGIWEKGKACVRGFARVLGVVVSILGDQIEVL